MNTHQTKLIPTDHKDLIQDIAFDFYGRRVATASLDQSVMIWNINEKNEWNFKEKLIITPGLYKVTWAHPEFGSLIAVACDRNVWIYEEASFGSGRNNLGWVKRMPPLSDARATITDIKFAPKFLGLQLVVCAQNGDVKIYECNDVLSSNAWTLIHPEVKTNMTSCSSCSWSTCFNLPVLLALGSDDSTDKSEKLVIFEYNENNRNYSKISTNIDKQLLCSEPIRSLAFAPSLGKLYHVLAIASRSLLVSTIKPGKEANKYSITTVTLESDVSVWRVCWNTVGSVLASASDDRKVRLWKCNYIGSWKPIAEISGESCSILVAPNFTEDELFKRNNELNQRQQSNTRSSIMN